MSEPGDIWQRYDAKVVQIQKLEAQLAALEKDLEVARHERDHWARVGRQLSKKLQVARTLAERLRSAGRMTPLPAPPRRPAEFQVAEGSTAAARTGEEFDRAREVLGLVLTALTKALDDDEVAELGRRLRHHAGGKLLHSITRGSLTLVPVDGRYLVDRQWLALLDLPGLRNELDIAAQSGMYALPEDSSSLLRSRGDDDDLEVDLDDGDEPETDAYGDSQDLPPPPPLPAAGFSALPPLLSALPEEDIAQPRSAEGSRPIGIPRMSSSQATWPGNMNRPPEPARTQGLAPPPEPVRPPDPLRPQTLTRIPAEPPRPAPPRVDPPPRVGEPPRTDPPSPQDLQRAAEPPRPPSAQDTVRGPVPQPPLSNTLIPNLRLGRLVKTPGAG